MKFKGDIIITDPCYIIKEQEQIKFPNYSDYGISDETYRTGRDMLSDSEKVLVGNYQKIVNEYYIEYNKHDDWSRCDYGDNMKVLGIENYLCASTEYGDWSCTTVLDTEIGKNLIEKKKKIYFEFFNAYNSSGLSNEDKKVLNEEYDKNIASIDEKISLGSFCADAGLVAVFLLEDVLKYNPNFDYHISRPWTTTLIKDFDGDIEITHRDCKYVDEETGKEITDGTEVSVIGKGNINFFTTQTGL